MLWEINKNTLLVYIVIVRRYMRKYILSVVTLVLLNFSVYADYWTYNPLINSYQYVYDTPVIPPVTYYNYVAPSYYTPYNYYYAPPVTFYNTFPAYNNSPAVRYRYVERGWR